MGPVSFSYLRVLFVVFSFRKWDIFSFKANFTLLCFWDLSSFLFKVLSALPHSTQQPLSVCVCVCTSVHMYHIICMEEFNTHLHLAWTGALVCPGLHTLASLRIHRISPPSASHLTRGVLGSQNLWNSLFLLSCNGKPILVPMMGIFYSEFLQKFLHKSCLPSMCFGFHTCVYFLKGKGRMILQPPSLMWMT